jgi:pimeloyl-ACP methyl ester carboxylesterase/membrane protein DedA with SNARE-associated domain
LKTARLLVLLYLLSLLASHVYRRLHPLDGVSRPDQKEIAVRVVGSQANSSAVRIAYRDWGPAEAPVILLLHGSPGDGGAFEELGPMLAQRYRVIAPDLPGFGGSTWRIPDYSIKAHARYLTEMMDSLRIPGVHVVGWSLGGGVALELQDQSPDRVRSITLLASIGAQEMELLGEYHINHAIHGLQLFGLWFLTEATPNFGFFDGAMLGYSYARNFYDTDQRPLRGILERYPGPMLIIHGSRDPLVAPAAALEHHRLVPQSELVMLQGDHFMPFMHPEVLVAPLSEFVDRVEQGKAPTRATADPERIAQAAQPFDATRMPPARGLALAIALLVIAAATLVSEDLTCIAAGLLVARGSLTFWQATIACLIGIVIGDLLLYLLGRSFGRFAINRAPMRWIVGAEEVRRMDEWFARRGFTIVLASRFIPGTRLPTYVAAGVLRTSTWRFLGWFLFAAALWTPLLVGGSALIGAEAFRLFDLYRDRAWIGFLLVGLALFLAVKLVLPLFTWRGRRLLLGKWRRLTRWEYWPPWAFYPPVVLYVLYLGLKHRSLTLFTSVNPAIPGGGFVGESKSAILSGLHAQPEHQTSFTMIPGSLTPAGRVARGREFLANSGLRYPVVIKPDAGERGSGVVVAHTDAELAEYLEQAEVDSLVQEYVHGHELGVFYYRLPGESNGRIFSITEKRLPVVTGDGMSTLEELILKDERAVCMAKFFFRRHAGRLLEVPPAGRQVALGLVGNHCRGAAFYDGIGLRTPEMEAAIDRLSQSFRGFHFGRYDIRTPHLADFQVGQNFKVLELNGATSEATHIYDPRHSVWNAWRTLFEQWRILFEIAARNREAGVQPVSLRELARSFWEHRRRVARHVEA